MVSHWLNMGERTGLRRLVPAQRTQWVGMTRRHRCQRHYAPRPHRAWRPCCLLTRLLLRMKMVVVERAVDVKRGGLGVSNKAPIPALKKWREATCTWFRPAKLRPRRVATIPPMARTKTWTTCSKMTHPKSMRRITARDPPALTTLQTTRAREALRERQGHVWRGLPETSQKFAAGTLLEDSVRAACRARTAT